MRGSLHAITTTVWRGVSRSCTGGAATELDHVLTRFRSIRCFSAGRARSSPQLLKGNPEAPARDESDAFYVVRKGDLVGVYKTLSDCQAQVSSSVCDPSVSVFKGYSLRKETEEYLASRGINHAIYSLNAVHVKEDLFGSIVPCPFKQPNWAACVVDRSPEEIATQKGSAEMQPDGATCVDGGSPKEIATKKESSEMQPVEAVFLEDKSPKKKLSKKRSADLVNSMSCFQQPDGAACFVERPLKEKATEKGSEETMTCILEFDGSSKGNPGKAGAGAILRNEDGSVVCRLREGLGTVTNNSAEYRALIMGLKYALKKGYKKIRVQGDSHLICMQVSNVWQTKNQNMTELCKEAKELKDKFLSFNIRHVKREFNSEADAQANLAADLPAGHVYVE